jgi:hypothetical protein
MKVLYNVIRKRKEGYHLGDLGVDGRVILQGVQQNRMRLNLRKYAIFSKRMVLVTSGISTACVLVLRVVFVSSSD